MDYNTFVKQLNEQELISKIEEALNSHLDIFIDVEEDTIVTEKMDRFYNSEEVYLFKVDLDYNDIYENAEVSIKIDVDQMIRLAKMADAIESHFMNSFEGE